MSGRRIRSAAAALAAVALAASLTACATDGRPADQDPSVPWAEGAGKGTITVFAAASLSASFDRMGARFTEETGIGVAFSFAGSQDLVAQVLEGAPADVLATADLATMQRVIDEAPELLRAPARTFATNTLLIVTPRSNPAGIRSWADLATDGLKLVVCAPEVPCGAATERIETSTGVTLNPVSEESKVTDVLAKVAAGEADAGLVYETDADTADVATVPCPECAVATNAYQAAPLMGAHPEASQAFADFLLSETGQGILGDAGFGEI